MPRAQRHRPIRLIRAVLLVGMLVLIAAVAGLLFLGRSSRPLVEPADADASGDNESLPSGDRDSGGANAAAAPAAAAGADLAEGTMALSEGFDYEQQVEGRPVFRLQGDRFVTDREGRVELEGVRLTLYHDVEPYQVSSERATYQPETQEASLRGNVRVEEAQGWSIASEQLDLVEGGRVVVTSGGRARVEKSTGLVGGAQQIRYEIDGQRLILTGKVILSSSESDGPERVGLVAERVEWERAEARIRARIAVHLSWGESVMRADAIDARTEPEGGRIEEAVASGSVRGDLLPGDGRSIRFTSASARAIFGAAAASPSRITLSSDGSAVPVRLLSDVPGEAQRRLSAADLDLAFDGGAISRMTASGGAELEESTHGGVPRRARADEIEVELAPDAAIRSAELRVSVQIQDEQLLARGDLAVLGANGQTIDLTGAPAFAKSERGELAAPRIRYDRESGRMVASGGVRGQLEAHSTVLPSASQSSSSAPLVVEAAEATLEGGERSFVFTGSVQAVQGDTLLFAEQLEGDEGAGRLLASGPVRTVWTDRTSAGVAAGTTIIQAQRLEYDRAAGTIDYLGGVRIRQAGREIRADHCRAELDEEDRVRSMRASGAVIIDDPDSGRTVTGDVGDYDLAAQQILVSGDPVVLRERTGGILRGRRAVFDLKTGAARILSGAP